MPRIHHLKSWPEPFAALKSGAKTFEIRKDDRGYMVGDILHLREWDPGVWDYGPPIRAVSPGIPDPYPIQGRLTGDYLWRRVVYKTPGGSWGLPPDVCVLGLEPCEAPEE